MSIILDSGLLFAFSNKDDVRHQAAKRAFSEIGQGTLGAPFVSDIIIAETLTLVRVRTRNSRIEQAAGKLFPLPISLIEGLTVTQLTPEELFGSADIFEKYRDQSLSFVISTIIALMKSRRIKLLASLDGKLRTVTKALGCELYPDFMDQGDQGKTSGYKWETLIASADVFPSWQARRHRTTRSRGAQRRAAADPHPPCRRVHGKS